MAKILDVAGVEEPTIAYIGGLILLVVGWGHKIMKVIGLAEEPKK